MLEHGRRASRLTASRRRACGNTLPGKKRTDARAWRLAVKRLKGYKLARGWCDGPWIHVILAAYGFWLPNDPHGSWSDFVGKWELLRFGRATKSLERRELVELTEEELRQRDEARKSLKYPPVQFTGMQARAIGRGFAAACSRSGYTIWACSILPEHTHLVIARHRYKVERIANRLKGQATRRLIDEGIHPLAQYAQAGERPPRMWAEHEWKVFLDSEEAIENAIRYVNENPIKEDKPAQQWSFVKPFTGLVPGWINYH